MSRSWNPQMRLPFSQWDDFGRECSVVVVVVYKIKLTLFNSDQSLQQRNYIQYHQSLFQSPSQVFKTEGSPTYYSRLLWWEETKSIIQENDGLHRINTCRI